MIWTGDISTPPARSKDTLVGPVRTATTRVTAG